MCKQLAGIPEHWLPPSFSSMKIEAANFFSKQFAGEFTATTPLRYSLSTSSTAWLAHYKHAQMHSSTSLLQHLSVIPYLCVTKEYNAGEIRGCEEGE